MSFLHFFTAAPVGALGAQPSKDGVDWRPLLFSLPAPVAPRLLAVAAKYRRTPPPISRFRSIIEYPVAFVRRAHLEAIELTYLVKAVQLGQYAT